MSYGVKTWYNGYLYDSKAEKNYAEYLDRLLGKKKILWWKRQVWIDLGTCEIEPDFLVGFKDKVELHEVKNGLYTPEFLYKYELLLEQHPNIRCFILEPDLNENWTKTPLAEFIKPHLQVQAAPTKQYTKTQIFLSKCFYKLASIFV